MAAYRMESGNTFFHVISTIAEKEIRPGQTVSFWSEVDLTKIEKIRRDWPIKAKRPTYTAFVVKALALALKEFPYANRRLWRRWLPFSGVRLQQFLSQDVSVACERNISGAESVAFLDVIRDAAGMPLKDVSTCLRNLSTCDESNNTQWRDFKWICTRLPGWLACLIARIPTFSPRLWSKYRGGAAIVSSPAKYGVDGVVASWTAPLGVSFGLVKPRSIVKNGELTVCPTFQFLLNWDRRVMAGAQAARFFKRIVDILEDPEAAMGECGSPCNAVGFERVQNKVERDAHAPVLSAHS